MLRTLLGASILTLAACSSATSTKTPGTDDPVDDCASNPEACDADGDGFRPSEGDCDDADAAVNPAATEACNGKDEDCDGTVDEEVTQTWYADTDGDGFGNPASAMDACEAPAGYIPNGTDCDDTSVAVYPGNTETCDGLDNDCDGTADDGVDAVFYADADGDGYGDAAASQRACSQPSGYVSDSTDCDDRASSAFPGNNEVCDEVDNNCDGTVDEGVQTSYYADMDGDGYGNAGMPQNACSTPTGYVTDSTDCDDASGAVSPAATETCNTVDDDCDGTVDEPDAADARTWYADTDGDGYGNASTAMPACEQPSGYVGDATDCDDARALSNPAATEYCNGYDDDCDGTSDEPEAVDASTWYADADRDTYGDPASATVACTSPSGHVPDSTDCIDTSAISYPGADEICDGLDNDCDGTSDNHPIDGTTYYADADGDGFGNPDSTVSECSLPSGYTDNVYDCDDGDTTEPRVADVVMGSMSGVGSMSDPYDTIQAAIDAANVCVVVYPGTYSESIDLSGKSIDVWGIDGAETTVIDANFAVCSASSPSGCGTAVTIASGTGAAPTLRGLTITGGSGHTTSSTSTTTCADSSASHSGTSTCSVTTYDICGGGVYVNGDDPVFEGVIVRDNVLPDFGRVSTGSYTQNWMYSYGGGVCVHDGNVSFSGSLFEGNSADQGGAIYADRASVITFAQGLISENEATDGGGVNLNNASASFTNAIVACNDATTDGGGVFTEVGGTSLFYNTVLFGNTSSVSGSARGLNAYVGASTSLSVANSIVESALAANAVWGAGSGAFNYDNVYNSVGGTFGGTLAAGTGFVSSGGNFVRARCDGNAYNDSFVLASGSAGLDAGDPAVSDVDGSRSDMGAYGGSGGVWSL
jgi:predicted outer membrane repeat protein